MLKINNLSKAFADYPVLSSLNWEVPDGKVFGLIGSNGAGKSTLMRCISQVYDYDGDISLDGAPIADRKEKLFFVSDEPFYFNRFNTSEMRDYYRIFYPDFDQEYYRHLLELFHFDEKKPLHLLSRGLKRQSIIILALSCKPRLILMDESFDGLDPMVRLTLKRELIKLVDAGETSVIISSHNIRELEDICDEMALLEKKQIAFTQSLEDLRQNYHKVQLGYSQAPAAEVFEKMPVLSYEINNKVVTVVYHGDAARQEIEATEPILFNPLPLSMEEIFVVEMEVSQNEK
ncbi:MAG: ABC transporter ATP-binding protein [Clostridiaceae bacterium]|nr:ABC transporter ATP-binding protein [Clostridiaceae bacterium]